MRKRFVPLHVTVPDEFLSIAMKVLVTSHIYTAPANRAKLAALAAAGSAASSGDSPFELTVVTPRRWTEFLFEVPAVASHSDSGYRLVALPVACRGRNNLFFYLANLHRLVRELKPDIIHIEQEPCSTVTAQWLWAASAGRGDRSLNSGRPKVVLFSWENLFQQWRPPQLWWERLSLARADCIIVGNTEAAEVLRRKGFRGPTPLLPISGVTIQPSHSGSPHLRSTLGLEGCFAIGFVGRLVAEKGVDVLIDAVAPLALREPPARLLAVGAGPYLPRLRASPHCTAVGSVPHERVSDYLRAMDVLVLPSLTTPRWKEQFGLVLVQAMASGVPVIGSDSGAIPETMGDAGLVVPEGDAGALREALVRLQGSPELRAELAARGRARVDQHFTHSIIAARSLDIYHSLL